jgi:hypothetical protein
MAQPGDKLLVRLSDLRTESIDWLSPGRLATGKLALFDGDPSQGKSLLTLDLAARLTTGRPLLDGNPALEPAAVVLLAPEDGLCDTVLPRLLAAGADPARVHVLRGRALPGGGSRPPTFPGDCDLLRDSLRETRARLVIADPLDTFLDPRLGGLGSPLIRQALDPLAEVAAEARAVVTLVRHLNKPVRSTAAVYRGLGSIAIMAACPTALLVGRHPDDPDLRVVAVTRNKLGDCPPALSFRIVGAAGDQPVIEWAGPVDLTADDLVLRPGPGSGRVLARAVDLLRGLLAAGPCPQAEVLRRAQHAGIGERTLDRAKGLLGVESRRTVSDGRSCWAWSLPAGAGAEVFIPDEPFTEETARQVEEVWRTEEAATPTCSGSTAR